MSKDLKVRKHKLSENTSFFHVLIVTLLMICGYFALAQVGLPIITAVLSIPFGMDKDQTETFATFVAAAGGLVILLIYYLWFRPEYKWKPRNTSQGFKLFIPLYIHWFILFGIVYTISAGKFTFSTEKITVYSFIFALCAGITEEAAYREVGISYMKRQLKKDNMNLPILLITSAVFGISHFINYFRIGAEFKYFLLQGFWTFLLGILLGAVFIRTGSIWPCITVHFLHDFIPDFFIIGDDIPMFMVVTQTVDLIILAAFGLWFIRKEKYDEIRKVWEDKWQV